jgi:hypothetical protein
MLHRIPVIVAAAALGSAVIATNAVRRCRGRRSLRWRLWSRQIRARPFRSLRALRRLWAFGRSRLGEKLKWHSSPFGKIHSVAERCE